MDGRELYGYLNYTGMSRAIRELAVNDKIAPIEEIAIMSEVEVCELVAKEYQLVYAENEEVGLVHNDDTEEVFNKIKKICR